MGGVELLNRLMELVIEFDERVREIREELPEGMRLIVLDRNDLKDHNIFVGEHIGFALTYGRRDPMKEVEEAHDLGKRT